MSDEVSTGELILDGFVQVEGLIQEKDHITKEDITCPDCDRVHTDCAMANIETVDGGAQAVCNCGTVLIRLE